MIKLLAKEKNISLGYVFGSFIKVSSFNDIDIGVVLQKNSKISNKLKYSMHLGHKFEKEFDFKWIFDVKILNFMPIHFQFAVIKDGKLFFSRDEKDRISYEKKVINLYLDFKNVLLWHERQILERA